MLDAKIILIVVERSPANIKILFVNFVYKKNINFDGFIKEYKVQYVV